MNNNEEPTHKPANGSVISADPEPLGEEAVDKETAHTCPIGIGDEASNDNNGEHNPDKADLESGPNHIDYSEIGPGNTHAPGILAAEEDYEVFVTKVTVLVDKVIGALVSGKTMTLHSECT